MAVFKNNNGNLKRLKSHPFNLEKDLQNLCEDNLEELFNLKFIASEFSIQDFRIDTLAFDQEMNAFVIIEYKNTKNYSVIDQGYSYLANLLNNKADFILKYIETTDAVISKKDVEWSQSKIYFVSPKFTKYQLRSINFKDLPIYLYNIKRYEDNIIDMELIQNKSNEASINTVTSDEDINRVKEEIKVYTEEDHLENTNEQIIDIYKELKEEILDLGEDVSLKATKLYIAFLVNNKDFCDITIQKSQLKIFINLNIGQLNDPNNIMRDVSKVGHWGNGDYEVLINSKDNIYEILSLIKQSYDKKVD